MRLNRIIFLIIVILITLFNTACNKRSSSSKPSSSSVDVYPNALTYTTSNEISTPSSTAKNNAKEYKITDFYKLGNDIKFIKSCLNIGYPVLISVDG